MRRNRQQTLGMLLLLTAVSLLESGCVALPSIRSELPEIAASDIPRELQKVALPAYRVEPPDILLIQAVSNIRPADDPLSPGDQLIISVINTLPEDPNADPLTNQFKTINSTFQIQANGTIDFGPIYGTLQLEGLTLEESRAAIEIHLRETAGLKLPKVSIALADLAGKQPITGEHLVRPDGTVSLGIYGSIFVTGMTLDEVRAGIEAHLSPRMHKPEVQVDVIAYNSKVYYVITDRAGFGEQVVRLPFTGNETVLDAIAQINGLSDVSSKKIWVARPAPDGMASAQTMVVDWRAIAQDGVTTTNYQLFPGDRVFVQADHLITLDNFISKATAPFERIYGHIFLAHGLVRELQFGHLRGGNSRGGGGGF